MTAHDVSIDELDGEHGDVAYAAFCDGDGCLWRGQWWHADTFADFPAVSAYADAEECAREDGAEHLDEHAEPVEPRHPLPSLPALDANGYAVTPGQVPAPS